MESDFTNIMPVIVEQRRIVRQHWSKSQKKVTHHIWWRVYNQGFDDPDSNFAVLGMNIDQRHQFVFLVHKDSYYSIIRYTNTFYGFPKSHSWRGSILTTSGMKLKDHCFLGIYKNGICMEI
jgi:hypothetical protein